MMNIYGKILIKNRIITAGIKIENGRIAEISKQINGKKVKGIIMPAGIDVHVHLRDFEESHKETIKNGTISALNGGICLVVDQPNSKPFIDSEERYLERVRYAEKFVSTDYSLNIGLTNKNLDKINDVVEKLKKMGFNPAIGEIFLQHDNPEYEIPAEKLDSLRHFSTIHAELPEFVESNNIPNFKFRKREAEIKAVEMLCSGNHYFCHISTKEAIEMISKSKSYVEVTPHHILLDETHYNHLKNKVNVNPPLRKPEDREFILENISLIDVIASDHAPHTLEEKESGASGYPSVETMYPLLMGLVFYGKISVFDVADKVAVKPAEIFGFEGYGEIKVGNYANFAVFDISKAEKIKGEKLHSFHGWTPFEGFHGIFPHFVMLRGEVVKEGDEIITGYGRIFKREIGQ